MGMIGGVVVMVAHPWPTPELSTGKVAGNHPTTTAVARFLNGPLENPKSTNSEQFEG